MTADPHVWWYVARAGGLVSWGLVTAAVVWGLLVSTRALKGRPSPAWLFDLHQYLGGLSVVFTGVHLAGLVADGYVQFGPAELLVPLASRWRPGAVAWGVVAMYLLVAVEVTSRVRRLLPKKAWRLIHQCSVALFTLVTVHAFAAGSEAGRPAVQWAAVAAGSTVVFLGVLRALSPRRARARARTGGAQPARARAAAAPSAVNSSPPSASLNPASSSGR